MYKVNLTPAELIGLSSYENQYQSNRKILRRIKCLRLRNEWILPWQIAEKLDVSYDSITDRMKLYTKWWFKSLLDLHYTWRRVSEFEQYRTEICTMIDEKIYGWYAELYADLVSKHIIKNKCDALRRYCKKIWKSVSRNVI
jgi:hypothetical protein